MCSNCKYFIHTVSLVTVFSVYPPEGIFQIPTENLILLQPSRMIQGLDELFVKKLERDMEKMREANYDIVFAIRTAKDITKADLNSENVASYTYEVIGGAHSTTAAQRLHACKASRHFRKRCCRIYVGMKDEETMWLGSSHNQTGGCRHQMTS